MYQTQTLAHRPCISHKQIKLHVALQPALKNPHKHCHLCMICQLRLCLCLSITLFVMINPQIHLHRMLWRNLQLHASLQCHRGYGILWGYAPCLHHKACPPQHPAEHIAPVLPQCHQKFPTHQLSYWFDADAQGGVQQWKCVAVLTLCQSLQSGPSAKPFRRSHRSSKGRSLGYKIMVL